MPRKRANPPTSDNVWGRKRLRPRTINNTAARTDPAKPADSHNPSTISDDEPTPDRLSTLPTELILLITRHLHPQTATKDRIETHYVDNPPNRIENGIPVQQPTGTRIKEVPTTVTERKFQHHQDLLALSRTCKLLHTLLSPELLAGLVRTARDGVDPLRHAVLRMHLPLAKALLERGYVEATEERLMYCMNGPGEWRQRPWKKWEEVIQSEKMRQEVVRILVGMGVGKEMMESWYKQWGHEWPKMH